VTIVDVAQPAVIVDTGTGELVLSWAAEHHVYRCTEPYFVPSVNNLLATTGAMSYEHVCALGDPSNYCCVLAAVTAGGQEGPASRQVGKSGLGLVVGELAAPDGWRVGPSSQGQSEGWESFSMRWSTRCSA
jgi:hypothetical protein